MVYPNFHLQAQFLKKLGDKAKKAAERRKNRKKKTKIVRRAKEDGPWLVGDRVMAQLGLAEMALYDDELGVARTWLVAADKVLVEIGKERSVRWRPWRETLFARLLVAEMD